MSKLVGTGNFVSYRTAAVFLKQPAHHPFLYCIARGNILRSKRFRYLGFLAKRKAQIRDKLSSFRYLVHKLSLMGV